MQKLKALADELHLARLTAAGTNDPLLRVAAYDAWCRFKHEKRKNPQDAVAAEGYFRSLLRGRELPAPDTNGR
jgi:hypothetical protein